MTSIPVSETRITEAGAGDLAVINAVIDRAVLGWPLPQRVKRLALPLLQYDAIDFEHYSALLCIREDVIGCAIWVNENIAFSQQYCGGLLHGLYIDPAAQQQGLGSKLLEAVFTRAADAGLEGMLVKAERVSREFFERRGMEPLPQSTANDYPYRYWQQLMGQAAECN